MSDDQLTKEDALRTMVGAIGDTWKRIRATGASEDQHITFVGLTDEELEAVSLFIDALLGDEPVDAMLGRIDAWPPRAQMLTALAADLGGLLKEVRKMEGVTIVSLRPGSTGERGLPG